MIYGYVVVIEVIKFKLQRRAFLGSKWTQSH